MAFRKGHAPWNKGLTKETNSSVARTAAKKKEWHSHHPDWGHTQETKDIISGSSKKKWENTTYKAFMSEALRIFHTGRKLSPEHCASISAGRKGIRPNWSVQGIEVISRTSRDSKLGKPRPQWVIEKIRKAWYEKYGPHWTRPKEELETLYLERKMTCSQIGQLYGVSYGEVYRALLEYEIPINRFARKGLTSPERILQEILDKEFPDQWKYTGNGTAHIAHHYPDFVNTNGINAVIEVFGMYWHENDSPEKWIQDYQEQGYGCLVLWENELEEVQEVIRRVKDLVSSSSHKSG